MNEYVQNIYKEKNSDVFARAQLVDGSQTTKKFFEVVKFLV